MLSEFEFYTLKRRLLDAQRAQQILRETLDRRIYLHQVIDSALVSVEVELTLLSSTIEKLKGDVTWQVPDE